ncbi:FISUMP domain-containing protein [Arenibacter echinorum]|uniref:Uncharacterized protein (TIGR02145 family) n=1 Tax=Arenibacter echinorum TaxID=440515 RepID=A0A327R883_9FLAO|nr:FISUMP domain-containing protein [Arenibacter echinorum]RAJ12375.1 uncharacterized protein (TIGR02145 family) [Arenibacter echinorum]
MKRILSTLIILIPLFLFVIGSCSKKDEITVYDFAGDVFPVDGGTISPKQGTFESGETVTITAIPSNGFYFKNWSGDISGTSSSYSLTITSDTEVIAVFEKNDTDGDGVPDDIDKCPETSAGETVNVDGCSESQEDSDGDSVTDELDQCPDTPTGEAVDDEGCSESQKDTDGDGVTDNLDECSDTDQGLTVDDKGCAENQSDMDGDGVPNNLDLCPGTSAGETVNQDGCSESQQDSDGDSVTDELDQCPDTPTGETVDDDGCSDSQKDTDGDGVTDDLDQCQNTPSGEQVSSDGCSSTQTDSDGDTVNDELDQCPNTPTGETVDAQGCSGSQKDSDSDGVTDDIDLCPGTQSGETVDSNGCSATQTDSAPSAVIFNQAPAHNATDVNTPISISWLASTDAEGDAITYDVYLGTNSANLDLVSPNQTTLSFTSTELELGTTYYFRVDAKSTTFVTSSEVRSFESSFTGSFTDNRDSHVYGTIKIGSQVWMTENLVFNTTGSYSYDDNTSNDVDYGRLYEWAFVQAAIPTGWHLPTDDEWKTLETELGMPASDLNITGESTVRGTDQGTKMKFGGSSGLNFPMAGYRDDGTYSSINNRTYLWVNTDAGGGNIFRRKIEAASPSCFRFTNPAGTFAISVRLVKN